MINELEFLPGNKLISNVFTTNKVVQIDLKKKKIVNEYNLTELVDKARRVYSEKLGQDKKMNEEEVLNGLVYLPDSGTVLVTGKDWPVMFEVAFGGLKQVD